MRNSRSPDHPTIRDVAKAAGVSTKTVSRVLNDAPHVTAGLHAKVVAAIADLDFKPNYAAASLASRRSFTIGLVHDLPSPHYTVDLQSGILRRLERERYRLVVMPTGVAAASVRAVATGGNRLGVDGLLLAPPLANFPEILAMLAGGGIPFICLGALPDAYSAPLVTIDDAAAVGEVVDHLVAHGHRRIATVTGPRGHVSTDIRRDAFDAAIRRHSLDPDLCPAVEGGFCVASGLAAGSILLALKARPTAIFASNDDMAAGVLHALQGAGIRIPTDMSVVGFDDSDAARICWPPLTTVRRPTADIAWHGTDMLLARLGDSPGEDRRILPHELIIRNSVAHFGPEY